MIDSRRDHGRPSDVGGFAGHYHLSLCLPRRAALEFS